MRTARGKRRAQDGCHGPGCLSPQAGQQSCADQNQMCLKWAASGECKANPGFMEGTCPVSCDVCPTAATDDIPAWVRGLALANGTAPPPLRPMGEIKLFYSDANQAAAALIHDFITCHDSTNQ
mmetsp:Transcript_8356/g.26117  ORF Transcript_8356/g.26117 Transcript_8356/m.26117 type:complete len:123 (-) Transcript_8356:854-1222(-)